MQRRRSIVAAVCAAALVACQDASSPTAPEDEVSVPAVDAGLLHGGGGVTGLAVGAGTFLIGDLAVKFAFNGVQLASGTALGSFLFSVDLGDGEKVWLLSRVTCLAFDPVNGRAWFGGEIVRNRSTAGSGFAGDLQQPGRDIWFRILDTGRNAADPDRSTFVGFEGSAGIPTSEEYCVQRIWPDANARTNALATGSILIAAGN